MDISVIVPVYNVEKYLPKCLDSLCAQADCVKEIILVNDGSTDNSDSICRKYAEKDSRIRIIEQENRGLSATVRVGVNAASCEYIGFVDSDDYVEPDMYKLMSEKMLETGADVAICNHDTVDEKGVHSKPIEYMGHDKQFYVFVKNDGKFDCPIFPTLKKKDFIPAYRVTKLMKKESIVNNIAFEDRGVRHGEDVALVVPILFASQKIVYVRGGFYHYLQRSDSIVHTYNRGNLNDWRKISEILRQASKKYNYVIDDMDDVSLAWLLSLCLFKIRISSLSKKEKKEEYKFIGEDDEVKKLLAKVKIKTNFKHKVVFTLLKHRMYGLLALIY